MKNFLFIIISLFFISNALAAERVVNLVIGYKTVHFAGKSRIAITANNQIPAPTLHFKQGDHVTINVYNKLDEETAIHWHGILLPWQMDGVLGVTQHGIQPGTVFHYQFTLEQAGTYWYHAHAGLQEQQGLYGAFVIDPPTRPSYKFTKNYVIVLSDWSNTDPNQILRNLKKEGSYYSANFPLQPSLAKFIHDYRQASSDERKRLIDDYKMMQQMRMSIYDISDVAYDAFLLNGQPKTSPWTAPVKVGDVVRLRFIGAGGSTVFHVKIPNATMKMVHVQGNDVKPYALTDFTIAPGETYDVLVKIQRNDPYIIYAESIDTVGAAYGALITSPNQFVNYRQVAPFPEPLPVTRDMMAMMMGKMYQGSLPTNKPIKKFSRTKNTSSNHQMKMATATQNKKDKTSPEMDMNSSSHSMTNMETDSKKSESVSHDMPIEKNADNVSSNQSMAEQMKSDPNMKMDGNMPMDHSMHMNHQKTSEKNVAPAKNIQHEVSNSSSSPSAPAKSMAEQMKLDPKMKMDGDMPMDHSMHMNNQKSSEKNMQHEMSNSPASHTMHTSHDMSSMTGMSSTHANHSSMSGMNMGNGMKMDHGMSMNHSMDMSMPTEPSIIGDSISPPRSSYATSIGTKYEYLKATVKTNDPDKPVNGVINMELFGYMDRFIWFINGVPEHKAKPIIFEPGKRYRIVFTNTSMMRHPMHIHGHWFILRKGNGAYDPLLHTIEVAPGATITVDVDTDASGQWLFHCHLLYHMMGGMSRVFQYSTLIELTQNEIKPQNIIEQTAYINRPIVRVDEVRPIDPALVHHPMPHQMGLWLATFLNVGADPFNNVQKVTFKGLYGSDYNKLELFTDDAEVKKGKIENADMDIFYWRLLDQFWAIKGGVNYFYRPASHPYWQPGIGIEGLMPYYIDTDVRGYLYAGSVKLDVELSRDTQITNNFFIRAGIRSILASKTVTKAEIGSGLNQMRYIIRPYYRVMPGLNVFAEYEYEKYYGTFKAFQLNAGESASQSTVSFGLGLLF